MGETKVITKNKKADVCTLSLRLEDTGGEMMEKQLMSVHWVYG